MKNNLIHKIKSKVEVQILGKSVERFILKINKSKINIYKINKIDKNKYNIIIDYYNFDKLLKINTIYEIHIIRYLGIKKNSIIFFKNIHMFFIMIISIILIYFLSNMVWQVNIVTLDSNMKTKLYNSLKYYGIKKYSLKKKYSDINKIKEKLLKEYSSSIEWIEIEKKGTKYIVRFESRILKEDKKKNKNRHIVAKKNALIKNIYSSSGQIVVDKNTYVKKGDIIISGYIYSNDEIKNTVEATGEVYGEVWYETKVVYPFNYYEKVKTGKKKKVYSIKFINNEYELFNFSRFNDKIENSKVIVKNDILPFGIYSKNQEEIIVKTGMNTKEQLEIKAISLAYEKMMSSLKENEYIISHKVLDSKIVASGIEMKIFFSVCENISDYLYIDN